MYVDDPENPGTNLARCNTNFVNNYYKPGPGTSSTLLFANPSYERDSAVGYASWYFSGNFMEGTEGGMNDDNWLGVDGGRVGGIENIKSDTEFEFGEVATESAHDAFNSVLANAGASLPRLDTVDARIIAETRGDIPVTGDGVQGLNGGIIDSQDAVGGWPEYLTPSEDNIPADTDHDGMPDYWESENDLDPEDPEDGKIITEDGYSNLEHYLNSNIPYISTGPSSVTRYGPLEVTIFPNPGRDYILITGPEPVINVSFFDNSGKLVINHSAHSENVRLNISHLEPGIFIVRAAFKNGNTEILKFSKH